MDDSDITPVNNPFASGKVPWRKKYPERYQDYLARQQIKRQSMRKELIAATQRWRKKNPDLYQASLAKLRAHRALLRKENPEYVSVRKAENLRWRIKNRERARLATQAWRDGDPDRARKSRNRSAKNHPDTCRRHHQTRRARQRGASGSHSVADLKEILSAQRNRCANCRKRFGKARPPTLDHIMPLASGGTHDRQNLQFLCALCNSSKGNCDTFEFARRNGKLL